MKDWYTRAVTLSATKGLSEGFFAALKMTRFGVWSVTCTNVLRSDLRDNSRALLSIPPVVEGLVLSQNDLTLQFLSVCYPTGVLTQ